MISLLLIKKHIRSLVLIKKNIISLVLNKKKFNITCTNQKTYNNTCTNRKTYNISCTNQKNIISLVLLHLQQSTKIYFILHLTTAHNAPTIACDTYLSTVHDTFTMTRYSYVRY